MRKKDAERILSEHGVDVSRARKLTPAEARERGAGKTWECGKCLGADLPEHHWSCPRRDDLS